MGKAAKRRKKNEPKNARPKRAKIAYVDRPFEGLSGETDLVAMREIVPAATAKVKTTDEYGGREVTLASLLPDLIPGMVRSDGEVIVALQTATRSGDASRDVAANTLAALELEPGEVLASKGLPEPGPRLQDILEPDRPFEVTVSDSFDYILSEEEAQDDDLAQAVESSKDSVVPTEPVDGVDSAYWCLMSRPFVRWVRDENPEYVIDGIARLHARRESSLFDDARFLGAFRGLGVAVPVWELPEGTTAADLIEPMAAFAPRFREAIDNTEPLDAEERRARAGIVSRQVELR